jgi:Tol biopolymer transport system component
MKTTCLLAFPLATLTALPLLAQTPSPALLGATTPAALAVPGPENTLLQAVSDDGRWLLLTSASDRLVAGDDNAAADVFLLERTTGQLTLVSVNPAGRSGNGTSLAGGMSADARRVVFVSRASDLVADDTNGTWDVFVRDLATGATLAAGRTAGNPPARGPLLDPWISADGRCVVFRSLDPNLAPGGSFTTFNLYRWDLEENRIECLSTNILADPAGAWRLTEFALNPAGDTLAVAAKGFVGSVTELVQWQNLRTGTTLNCSPQTLAEFPTNDTAYSRITLSGDGRYVAFQGEARVPPDRRRHGLLLYHAETGTLTLLALRTNTPSAYRFPEAALHARLSADGAWVVYATPTPPDPSLPPAQQVSIPSQVFLYETATATTRQISTALDGVSPADADCLEPLLTPDGRGVAFLSRATNLVPDTEAPALRVYWYDRASATLRVLASLGDRPGASGQLVLSPNGDWLAAATTDLEGPVFVFNTREGTGTQTILPLAATESSTGRGWMGVRPAGVSADGRYVALTAFPPGPAGSTNHQQVYRQDTRTGTRLLVSRDPMGQLANGHPATPSLSADGARLLFISAASNLVPEDTNGVPDAFVEFVPDGPRTRLRPPALPSNSYAFPESGLSPNGRFAAVSFYEAGKKVWYLTDLNSGTWSAPLPASVDEPPGFSADGEFFVITRWPGTGPLVELHATADWFAEPGAAPAPRWVSATYGTKATLSADGRRFAFLHAPPRPSNYALVVVDRVRDQIVLSNLIERTTSGNPALSADGRYVVWAAPSSPANPANQVWHADVDSGAVTLVSVAADGASEGNGDSTQAAISADGRYVAFTSLASNLVANDGNNTRDIFLRDLQTGQTLLVSRTPAGAPGRGWSFRPFFSADGRSLFFLSQAPDLAAGDLNQTADLFKVEIVGNGPLVVIRRQLNAGRAELMWSGAPGKSYAIEYAEQLGSHWTRLPGDFSSETPVVLDTTTAAQRFYRVIELP